MHNAFVQLFDNYTFGEIKDENNSGFHNWIYFLEEEQKGNVEYRGYIKPRNRNNAETNNDDQNAETNNDDHVLRIQFIWNSIGKTVDSHFYWSLEVHMAK